MKRPFPHVALAIVGAATLGLANVVNAIGAFYQDPGWAYAFDGDQAYYHDPDGPNPDYVNGNDQNQPGGQGGQPALVNPSTGGVKWSGTGQWEGSAPGDPLGGVPMGIPPLPPPAPGGVGTYTETNGTTFLRVQDAGNPQDYGWADKGAQAAQGAPRQEGSNRRMLFGHDIATDAAYSGNPGVMDNGITISFRARLATRATGPLDDVFPEGGSTLANTIPWPEDGLGYDVHTEGRGMFMVTQFGAGGPGQMGFSLLDDDTVVIEGLTANVGDKRGLVMNGRSNPSGSPSTNSVTPASLNIVEIPDDQLDEWQEFWITVKKLPAPVNGNTHEINVYYNGSLQPQNFQVILDLQNEFGGSPYLGMGLSSDTRQGAFDVDFFAYKEGVIAPMLASDADFDDNGRVDGKDFLIWQAAFGGAGTPTTGDATGDGAVNAADFNEWKAKFGGPPVIAASGGVPEPTGMCLAMTAVMRAIGQRRRRAA